MKHLIFCLLAIFLSRNTNAQTIAHIKGNLEDLNHSCIGIVPSPNNSHIRIIYHSKNKAPIETVKDGKFGDFVFCKYDSTMKFVNAYSYRNEDENAQYSQYYTLNNVIYLVYKTKNIKENTVDFYAIAINEISLNTDGIKIQLCSIDVSQKLFDIAQTPSGVRFDLDKFRVSFTYSKDSSLFLVKSSTAISIKVQNSYKEKGYSNNAIAVFDKNMIKQWQKDFIFPFEERQIKIYSTYLTYKGNVAFLVGYTENGIRTAFDLLTYSKNLIEPSETKFIIENKLWHSFDIIDENSNGFEFIGLYCNRKNNIEGYQIGKLNLNSKDFITTKTDTFPQFLCNKLNLVHLGNAVSKTIKGLPPYFQLHSVIRSQTNMIDFLFEYQDIYIQQRIKELKYSEQREYVDYNIKQTLGTGLFDMYEFYGEIIDIKLKSNQSSTVSYIPKSGYSTFKVTQSDNSIFCLFYEAKPSTNNGSESSLCKKSDCFVVASIDVNGSVYRQGVLSEPLLDNCTIYFDESSLINKNRFVYYAVKPKLIGKPKCSFGYLQIK